MNLSLPETAPLTIPADGSLICIGRDPGCDIILNGAGISRRHAEIRLTTGNVIVRDLQSSFGTRVNDVLITESPLRNGDFLTIGIVRLNVKLAENAIVIARVTETSPSPSTVHADQSIRSETLIGRDTSNDIVCNHPLVSRFHAVLQKKQDGRFTLVDRQSANGLYVNGRLVRHAVLEDDDIVQVGPFRFFFKSGRLVQADDQNRVRIEANGLSVKRGRTQVLRDVSLSIQPGEFVVILGPSGAGKTTLAYALTGQVACDKGQVFLNGMPLERFAAAYSTSIGFVSQNNLLHPELTVLETFREQARLRLPADSLPVERYARIDEVMSLLELTSLAARRVGRLSGGEAKRVHLGIELLASPALILLDEPLAGLDIGLIIKFMELFKRISEKGHTVLLTTHTLENLNLADRIVFVNNGTIAFQGNPEQLRAVFGTNGVEDLYAKARTESRMQPLDAGRKGGDNAPPLRNTPMPFSQIRRRRGPSIIIQFLVLINRYTKILIRDTRALGLLLMQVPLICLLLALVYRWDTSFFPITFYFCVTISAIWIGGVNSIREIAREWDILNREIRAGLSFLAYGMSKLLVFSMLSCVQALLFAILLSLVFQHYPFDKESTLLIVLATVGGTMLGLAVSAASPRVSVAVSWLPIIFIPQVFFSGVLLPFDRMTVAGEWLSRCTVSRPVFSLFKRVYVLEQGLWLRDEWLPLFVLLAVLIIFTFAGIRIFAFKRR